MSHASYHVFFEGCVELTLEGMNELKYCFVLGGYLVWNLRVAHANPMTWNILARQDNVDALPIVSFQ